eukprot:CAMPEP_0206263430 /NCGR_PEP_ID=MMETSP0047_2-20121206/28814_1 /ASSEMBLY_ACC=CAM_ASM_000192 /TAXON_ID=195065 /ORGANISM="Chroomonas mesostigmatica_cf, Strain CCMP1168" /LENGTH=120 /DNA_ID=CAMNT_0053690971 /DNA_START=437 /DNA_END=799 /DNA_ORIENTATION=-
MESSVPATIVIVPLVPLLETGEPLLEAVTVRIRWIPPTLCNALVKQKTQSRVLRIPVTAAARPHCLPLAVPPRDLLGDHVKLVQQLVGVQQHAGMRLINCFPGKSISENPLGQLLRLVWL